MHVNIYTDGSCGGNPGPGGWAAILECRGRRKEFSGNVREATSNRMEILAAVKAMESLKRNCTITVHTDSAYLCNAFNKGWLEKWKNNGWKTSTGKPVKNKELWERLLVLTNRYPVKWVKVKGHSDNVRNNRCDYLAVTAMKKVR